MEIPEKGISEYALNNNNGYELIKNKHLVNGSPEECFEHWGGICSILRKFQKEYVFYWLIMQ